MLDSLPIQRRFARAESDERLVARIRRGEEDAFAAVYDRYAPGLLSFSRHLLGSLEEAEDAVQQTFMAAHRAMLADERELHLKAWLYAIARNRCLSTLRARRERVGLNEDLDTLPSTAGLAAEVEQREDLRSLLGDLARLPDDQRAALVLAELGAHSHDEIAEVLAVKREKVKALVFQAREALAAARTARDTPCEIIREQLATARGGALRRGNLRRHLDLCAGCRAFRDEVHHQRVAFSILLPVVPSLALKQAVLAATAAGGSAAAGAAGVASIAGAGGVKAASTKLLATLAIAGGAGGTGYVAVQKVDSGKVPTAVAALPAEREAAKAPSRAVTPLPPRRATVPTTSARSAPGSRGRSRPAGVRTRPAGRRGGDRDRDRDRGRAVDRGTVDAAAPPDRRAPLLPPLPVAAEEPKGDRPKGRKKAKKEHPHGGPPGQTKKERQGIEVPARSRPAHPRGGPPGHTKDKGDEPRGKGHGGKPEDEPPRADASVVPALPDPERAVPKGAPGLRPPGKD
jgi:RNA polymerase sigma factor (sigma-70 family)